MQGSKQRDFWGHLSTEPAGPREFRPAVGIGLLSALVFVLALPNAATQLPQLAAFVPIHVTALVICDLITAVLLFSQFRALQFIELAVLAGGYFFSAMATTAYALIFPGLFSPTGLLASGQQARGRCTCSGTAAFRCSSWPMPCSRPTGRSCRSSTETGAAGR